MKKKKYCKQLQTIKLPLFCADVKGRTPLISAEDKIYASRYTITLQIFVERAKNNPHTHTQRHSQSATSRI